MDRLLAAVVPEVFAVAEITGKQHIAVAAARGIGAGLSHGLAQVIAAEIPLLQWRANRRVLLVLAELPQVRDVVVVIVEGRQDPVHSVASREFGELLVALGGSGAAAHHLFGHQSAGGDQQ